MNIRHISWLWGFWCFAIAAVAQESVPTVASGEFHVVQSGETLFGLARRYQVTVGEFQAANGIRPGSILQIGTRLRIPGVAPAEAPSPLLPTAGVAGGDVTHEVKPGETLGRVAKAYGLTPEDLARANGIADPNRIRVGQRLKVPAAAGNSASAPTSAPAVASVPPAPTAPPAAAAPAGSVPSPATAAPSEVPAGESTAQSRPEETYHYYDVQPNDTLGSVATMFFTTPQELGRLNNIPATALLKAGQQLVVPTRRYFEELRRQGDMG